MKNHNLIPGVLLIYHHYLAQNAPTIMEHALSFERYSQYKIWSINTEYGFPTRLENLKFGAIILHYSLFGMWPMKIEGKLADYLKSTRHTLKIAFFQDEYTACKERTSFINDYEIDVVYTLLDPEEHQKVYYKNTSCKNIKHTLTGYVDDALVKLAKKITKPESKRTIDIGYRARPLPFFLGKGGQEKTMIAEEFVRRVSDMDLTLDIKTAETDRIYGSAWHYFVANCRAVIGVEAGSSIFDLEGKVKHACELFSLENPDATFEEVYNALLIPWEDNVYYRTISPRVFECASFKVCMILFEGRYNEILQPMVHYIPLKKDFSNFDQVMKIYNNKKIRKQLTENAFRDLIESEKYSYKNFVREFDNQLKEMGVISEISNNEIKYVTKHLNKDRWTRILKIRGKPIYKLIRKYVKYIIKPRKTIRKIYRHFAN